MAAVIGSLDLPGVERQIHKDISTWVCKTAVYKEEKRTQGGSQYNNED